MSLREELIVNIKATGPITVADYMRACLYDPAHGYYATQARLGGDGADFLTAPESSQMFGELIGLWCAHEWTQIGAPNPFDWIELGPGRGVLMQDALRATAKQADFSSAAAISFIEVSETLRAEQKARVPGAQWFSTMDDIPQRPALIIANEFLDCFPVRQFVRDGQHWREKLVGMNADGALAFGLSPPVPPPPSAGGEFYELAPTMPAFIETLANRLNTGRGRALFMDYGYAEPENADTLQALRAHSKEHPLASPGAADLTAHVDFQSLARLAREAGLVVHGPIGQGDFLRALGIEHRAAALAKANPEREQRIACELHRLTHESEMGVLFKALCLSSPQLPPPAGF